MRAMIKSDEKRIYKARVPNKTLFSYPLTKTINWKLQLYRRSFKLGKQPNSGIQSTILFNLLWHNNVLIYNKNKFLPRLRGFCNSFNDNFARNKHVKHIPLPTVFHTM
jgi:hypothetical protein